MSEPPNYEYYCHNCEELRLSIGPIKPELCKTCGSDKISIGEPGDDKLTKLRFGDKTPDAPITAIIFPSSTDVLSTPESSKTAKTEPPK